MKILITGGCGFLGTNLAEFGLNLGYEICIFDNLSKNGSLQNLQFLKKMKINFIHGDIRSEYEVSSVIKTFKPDAIFHLAGQVAMTTSIKFPRLDFETNVLGTLNVLEAVRKFSSITKIIYSSTNKVYGDLNFLEYNESASRYLLNNFPEGIPESLPLNFHSPYGCSKGAADQYILDYSRIYNIRAAVFRHSSMYGYKQNSSYDQGWVDWFCNQSIVQINDTNHSFSISGNGKQVRDLLHSEDMNQLYYKSLTNFNNINGQAFNIGGGFKNSLSLLELISLIEKILNIKLKYHFIEKRKSDQKVFYADLSKINQAVNWLPKYQVEEGINLLIKDKLK